MKVAIMTWFHYLNYGTALQVTALSEKLREIGHEPEVIRYKPCGYYRSIPEYSIPTVVKRTISRICKLHSADRPSAYASQEKEKLFSDFLSKQLQFSEKCDTATDLEALNNKYQAFICGSDQIWSPLCFDPHYFLDFVKEPKKKIAYAPSFGVTRIQDKYIKEKTKQLLSHFGSISVRETAGQKIVEELTGLSPELAVDPTLLFSGEEWETRFALSQDPAAKPYMLAYMLGNDPAHWDTLKEIAERHKLQLKIIPVLKPDINREGCIKAPLGPHEFLELFLNASYVCTDSFHGLVVSILFHKPFSVFSRFQKNDPQNQNSRINNLLDLLNLRNRLVDDHFRGECTNEVIDYSRVDNILREQREHSIEYLSKVLSHVTITRPSAKHVQEGDSLCCGCGACAMSCQSNAIQVRMNSDGFYAAMVDEDKCVSCGRCLSVCPFIGQTERRSSEKATMFSFKSREESVLHCSTSGGAAYHVARYLMRCGYAVLGCTFDPESQSARHILLHDERELEKIQGSKYLQSNFADALVEAVAERSKIAVFGTPCQISAAKRVLSGKDAVYIDLVCHGVPSYHLYTKYQDYLHRKAGIDPAEMKMIFRYKPKGWRSIHLYATDGTHSDCSSKNDDPFFRMFEVGNCYMKTCYECRWRGDSEADIRLGDYWGPRFEKDLTGVSMAIAFSECGKELIHSLRICEEAEITEQPISDYMIYQQKNNLPCPVFYESLISVLKAKDASIEDIVEKYAVPLENRALTAKERLRHLLKLLRLGETI